ncbi:competence type IV pilus minor pilin ComGF [Pseudalkalibacillus caeni]|uniref:Prepilin-type N-terminal cleavage/methylation domain-containing protein n=1 Tax=Exobacillus caeni TaxID=2574798 RepID=A0A5R9F6H8_9BACL|nr:competence type IV pilus minor pilin ComGF [Pseudalkalibacillus caeni]TLS36433.1 prepilin-type N-terminal cleavage/methylation domain-containing protein [Pseudalkalibacillus caeni]
MEREKQSSTNDLFTCKQANNTGFTLIELLIALSVLLILLSCITPFIKVIFPPAASKLDMDEFQLFAYKLGEEIREGHQLTVTANGLEFLNYRGETVQYQSYGTMIRRRVNGSGHDVVLQNISQVLFSGTGKEVRIHVKDHLDKEVERSFYQVSDE